VRQPAELQVAFPTFRLSTHDGGLEHEVEFVVCVVAVTPANGTLAGWAQCLAQPATNLIPVTGCSSAKFSACGFWV
jgi:hypothetical protein